MVMGKFLADIWNGKTFSLAKHYWLFLVLPSAVFTVLVKVLDFNSLSFNPISYGWVSGILWTITVIVFVVGYVGLINCARIRSFRGWSGVAVTLTTIGAVLSVLKIVANFSENPLNDVQQLYDSVASINAQLPKKVDAITTLTKAEYSNNVFTYYLEIDPTAYQSPNWSTDRLKANITTNACSTFKGSLGTFALRSVRYVYETGARDNLVIEVGERDCEGAR
jgi:hypothetical protein